LPPAFVDFAICHWFTLMNFYFGNNFADNKKAGLLRLFQDTDMPHMWAIITSPNPEQDIWVAPSIKRAKS